MWLSSAQSEVGEVVAYFSRIYSYNWAELTWCNPTEVIPGVKKHVVTVACEVGNGYEQQKRATVGIFLLFFMLQGCEKTPTAANPVTATVGMCRPPSISTMKVKCDLDGRESCHQSTVGWWRKHLETIWLWIHQKRFYPFLE